MKSFAALLLTFLVLLGDVAHADPQLRMQATPALAALAKDLVRPLRENGIEIKLAEESGNTQVVGALAAGDIDVALLSRPLKTDERVANPAMRFAETRLGSQVVSVVVSRNVWETGVHALKREQVLGLYENKFRSWKDVGGEDRPMIFFEPAHERGPWEIFATWLYGDLRIAPAVSWQVVADGADTQNALQFASGGISVASVRWVDNRDVFPIAIINDQGKVVQPTKEAIVDGTYPLARPIVVVFPQTPAAEKKKMLDFLMSDAGQKIVKAHDFVPQNALDEQASAAK